jgi:hypothetical protein
MLLETQLFPVQKNKNKKESFCFFVKRQNVLQT